MHPYPSLFSPSLSPSHRAGSIVRGERGERRGMERDSEERGGRMDQGGNGEKGREGCTAERVKGRAKWSVCL